jgi:hypothetical protein
MAKPKRGPPKRANFARLRRDNRPGDPAGSNEQTRRSIPSPDQTMVRPEKGSVVRDSNYFAATTRVASILPLAMV